MNSSHDFDRLDIDLYEVNSNSLVSGMDRVEVKTIRSRGYQPPTRPSGRANP